MSWLSRSVNKVRRRVDKIGSGNTAFRYGIASMGGGMGLQYEYSRNKGMNSNEATKNATTGGYSYKDARQMQKSREAGENEAERMEAEAARVDREREKARQQIAVRVRRGSLGRGVNRVGQTLAAGLGTTGSPNTGATFASMLGL